MQVVPIKSLGTLGSLLSFWLFCRLSFVLPASVRTEVVAAAGKVACRCCLWWLGFWRVSWVQVGVQDGHGGSNGSINGSGAVPVVGIVSNHLSWCDILLHMSHSFPCFVARAQTSSQPIIGIIRCTRRVCVCVLVQGGMPSPLPGSLICCSITLTAQGLTPPLLHLVRTLPAAAS
jgi:hypothetical protein